MKCKVINASKNSLEDIVNDWLCKDKYEIIKILQTESSSNGYITLTIFYLDQKEIRTKKLEKLNDLEKDAS